jgi:hypothetical protein
LQLFSVRGTAPSEALTQEGYHNHIKKEQDVKKGSCFFFMTFRDQCRMKTGNNHRWFFFTVFSGVQFPMSGIEKYRQGPLSLEKYLICAYVVKISLI